MIKVSTVEARSLESLPRNEAGFRALLKVLMEHRDQRKAELQQASIIALQQTEARSGALIKMGQVDALDEVIELLERQTEI